MKKFLLLLVVLILATALWGCTPKASDGTEPPTAFTEDGVELPIINPFE